MVRRIINKTIRFAFRNHYTLNNEKVKFGVVNIENWKAAVNIGDCLGPVVCAWMLEKKGIQLDTKVHGAPHLMTIGSILGTEKFPFDAVVWGSGLHRLESISTLTRYASFRKLDIRAVRGPITKYALHFCGFSCPEIYGDPAILFPLIYKPEIAEHQRNQIAVIKHFKAEHREQCEGIRYIDVKTEDYESFITEICKSSKVISSSLHGIILAEAYGVPAVFLQEGMSRELLKFYDWYYSTNRKNIRIAYSLEEAIQMDPMPLPELESMQKNLLDSFPYDLWMK